MEQIEVTVLKCEYYYSSRLCSLRVLDQHKKEHDIYIDDARDKIPTGKRILYVSEKYTLRKPSITTSLRENALISTGQCSHLFQCVKELRIIFCEKCGETKSV